MIKTEKIKVGGKVLFRTKSDTYKICQVETGKIFTVATDTSKNKFTYIETEILLPVKSDKRKDDNKNK